MRYPSFPRIWPWPHQSKQRIKGVISLIAVFIFFVFSVFGLGLLYLSQIHLKFSGYKKNSILLDCASENGIKQGLQGLIDTLSNRSSPSVISPEELGSLKKNLIKNESGLINDLLKTQIPVFHSDSWENLSWQSRTDFHLEKIEEEEDYFRVTYNAEILSEGGIKNFRSKRETSFLARMDILAGHIPLPHIPVLIDDKPSPEQQQKFLEEHKIEIFTSADSLIPSRVSFSEEKLLSKSAVPQLEKALKIKMFYPQDLSPAKLRAALGLEESTEAVPDGVYLIQDDLGLGGIFVQGNVQELVLAVEEDFQVVSFLTELGQWILKFSPEKEQTIYSTPTETRHYNFIPRGIIIVNGKIESLGGGVVHPAGEIRILEEEEIPSILQGVNLTIISSDEITLSSHLLHQGLKWQESVPYLKDSQSQLIIFAAGQDFIEGSEKEGKIVINADSTAEIKIQASLTASGKGVSLEGTGKNVNILGSLHTTDLTSNGKHLKITFDDRLLEKPQLLMDAPKTQKPVLYLASFLPLEWRESDE